MKIEIFEAEVERLSHEGRGIAIVGGKTTFVDQALPGDRIRATYTKRRARFDEAKTIEIIQASEQRVTPPCSHADICGGCSLQHMSPAAQIQFKQKVLEEQLQHFGQVNLKPKKGYLLPLLGPTLGYRRKARLGVKWIEKKNSVVIGFREKQGRYIADLAQCEILDVRVGHLMTPLKNVLNGLNARKYIPQIEVAIGDDQVVLVIRHLETLTVADQQALVEFAHLHQVVIYLQPKGPDSVHPLKEIDKPLQYKLALSAARPLHFQFRPVDFIQINAEINEKMIQQALDLLELNSQDRVLDLFCGLGNFTLPMADRAAHVIGVEGDDALVAQATRNAQYNQLVEKTTFYKANLFESVENQPWFHQSFTKILLDPPRSGALEAMSWLAKMQAERIVYVSCNPATLARDIGVLCAQGYQLETLGVMDMFPHTTHVESMALLVKYKIELRHSREGGNPVWKMA